MVSVYSIFVSGTLTFSLALTGSLEGDGGNGVPTFAIPQVYIQIPSTKLIQIYYIGSVVFESSIHLPSSVYKQ